MSMPSEWKQNAVYAFENDEGTIIIVRPVENDFVAGLSDFESYTNPDAIGDIMDFYDGHFEELAEDWALTPVRLSKKELVVKNFSLIAEYDGEKISLFIHRMGVDAMTYFRVSNL